MSPVMCGSWGMVLAATSLLGRLPSVEAASVEVLPDAQMPVGLGESSSTAMQGDLVFMHIPYNFGYTITGVAMWGGGHNQIIPFLTDVMAGKNRDLKKEMDMDGWSISLHGPERTWKGEAWAHLSPELQAKSEVTGCPLYDTPPKHWPSDIQSKYVHGKKVFGVLRDPYERLVAIFRGSNIFGGYEEEYKTCDVNAAVKKMMRSYIDGDIYAGNCTFLPQDEYYNGGYGVTISVDNRRFPQSMNEVFEAHGYSNMIIKPDDILHVDGCNNVWAADLDTETRAMVRQVYASDFDLLCRKFNYCEWEEATCLVQIDKMCPEKAFHWDANRDPPQYVENWVPPKPSSSSRAAPLMLGGLALLAADLLG